MGTFGNSTNEVFNPTVTFPVNAAEALAVVDEAHVFTVRISVFMGKVFILSMYELPGNMACKPNCALRARGMPNAELSSRNKGLTLAVILPFD